MSYNPKDFIAASITKSPMMEEAGLKITEYNGEFIIYEVFGVFETFTNVKKGSKLLKLQDKNIDEYKNIDEINESIKKNRTVRIEAARIPDFNDIMNDSSISESSGGLQLDEGLPAENL